MAMRKTETLLMYVEGIKVHQHPYILAMVVRYACERLHPALLPLPPSISFAADGFGMGELLPPGNLDGNLVRSLNNLAICTRPEISFDIGTLSRLLCSPRLGHRGIAVHLLRYV